jgi:hypothetical protein
VVAGTEPGGAVSVEPGFVGSAKDVFGAMASVLEGNESWVMREVGG